jgi:ppGpp synthetase/RelA/SpoT-type nucleotidyltranferase
LNDDGVDQLSENASFDFDAHANEAAAGYQKERDFYVSLANEVQRLIRECLSRRNIAVQSVDARAKEVNSFKVKAASPSDYDPEVPKYQDPLVEIDDLAGVRIIAFLPRSLDAIETMIGEEFDVFERSDKGAALIEEGRFGYQSIHYLVTLKDTRTQFSEYAQFDRAIVELQVRTILQHAWAEIEHDIQYKSASAIPAEISRRFLTLAGLLELADREFQAIQDQDVAIKRQARRSVEAGNLGAADIVPDAVKAYLNRTLGPDGRVSDFSYDWATRLLRGLGFSNLSQVADSIAGYDQESVIRSVFPTRPGQITRLQLLLLAAMGERFIERHLDAGEEGYRETAAAQLDTLRRCGIDIHDFDPLAQ